MGRSKKLRKSIRGIEQQIEKHEEKIEAYKGRNDTVIPYWQGEIKRLEDEKAAREKKLKRESASSTDGGIA